MIKIKKHKGFGDTVEAITKATGIYPAVKGIYKALDKPCGCEDRREKLNKIIPYGTK